VWITVPRTGYTGEPLCFELFVPRDRMEMIWERLVSMGEGMGIIPVGLGARDTLRLEANLPLYGQQLDLRERGSHICGPFGSQAGHEFLPPKGGFHRKGGAQGPV
jgi:aminomethyltransferase